VVVPLMADGQGPFDFVLDTGADTTIVDSSVAQRLSLASLGLVQQMTLAGMQNLNCAAMRTLAASSAHVENFAVLVQDLTGLRKIDEHIVGLVGQDFLAHFNYVLDYRKRLLRIELANELRDSVEGDRVPIEANGKRMMVASEAQSVGQVKLRLSLDSGATSVVLLRRASQALHLAAQRSGQELTSSGAVGMQVGRVRVLSVGAEQFHDIAVALPGAEDEQMGDGLLPTALFQTLYVNNREGFVVFNARVRKN
jgi:predicted aspartyl protease